MASHGRHRNVWEVGRFSLLAKYWVAVSILSARQIKQLHIWKIQINAVLMVYYMLKSEQYKYPNLTHKPGMWISKTRADFLTLHKYAKRNSYAHSYAKRNSYMLAFDTARNTSNGSFVNKLARKQRQRNAGSC